jgi:hypothetical protein
MTAPWEVSELEIQELPPSMLRNVDDESPGLLGGFGLHPGFER